MLWVGGARLLHLICTGVLALPIIALSLYTSPYQWQRVVNFFTDADILRGNYQIDQSLLALGSGGILGIGLGDSMQKQHFLPEPHTDFVFALVGEELGLAGTLSLTGLFVAFAIHGFRIAREAPTYYGFLVATGVTVMISVYALLNIGVVTGLLPTTGLPLPFISLWWFVAAVEPGWSGDPGRCRPVKCPGKAALGRAPTGQDFRAQAAMKSLFGKFERVPHGGYRGSGDGRLGAGSGSPRLPHQWI